MKTEAFPTYLKFSELLSSDRTQEAVAFFERGFRKGDSQLCLAFLHFVFSNVSSKGFKSHCIITLVLEKGIPLRGRE